MATPRRIFTVTGTSTAPATASTTRQASASSSIRCAPAPVFVTFRTGQPKFMSTMSAPAASTMRAASAMARGLGAEDLDRERVLVGRDAQVAERALVAVLDPGRGDHLGADETGSEAPSLPPKRLDRDAGHRCEDDPRGYLDGADRPPLLEVYRHPAMVSAAI